MPDLVIRLHMSCEIGKQIHGQLSGVKSRGDQEARQRLESPKIGSDWAQKSRLKDSTAFADVFLANTENLPELWGSRVGIHTVWYRLCCKWDSVRAAPAALHLRLSPLCVYFLFCHQSSARRLAALLSLSFILFFIPPNAIIVDFLSHHTHGNLMQDDEVICFLGGPFRGAAHYGTCVWRLRNMYSYAYLANNVRISWRINWPAGAFKMLVRLIFRATHYIRMYAWKLTAVILFLKTYILDDFWISYHYSAQHGSQLLFRNI